MKILVAIDGRIAFLASPSASCGSADNPALRSSAAPLAATNPATRWQTSSWWVRTAARGSTACFSAA